MSELKKEIRAACDIADWQQVVLNGGPPCFHLDKGRFCLRAKRWPGHDADHPFTALGTLIERALRSERAAPRLTREQVRDIVFPQGPHARLLDGAISELRKLGIEVEP